MPENLHTSIVTRLDPGLSASSRWGAVHMHVGWLQVAPLNKGAWRDYHFNSLFYPPTYKSRRGRQIKT